MEVEIFDDHETLSRQIAAHILRVVQRKPDAVLCLAAGDTPRAAYRLIAEQTSAANVDFSASTFIALDEWVGIAPHNEGSCSFFLHQNLFRPLHIAADRCHLFDALSDDLELECRKMDTIVEQKGGIDMMLVGIGMNGHIGFNEPGVSQDLYTHVIPLDATTKRVGQKYFKQTTKLQYGITLGLRHLLQSRTAIMMASGIRKASVITQALEGPITTEVPASIIRKHPDAIVMLDREAASGLKVENGE